MSELGNGHGCDARRRPRPAPRRTPRAPPPDGLLEGLAGLDEARQQRVAALRPARPAAQQEAVGAVDHAHDRHRVGPREVMRAACRQAALVPGVGDLGRLAAVGAVAVAAVPRQQRAGIGGKRGLACGQLGGGLAQAGGVLHDRARRRSRPARRAVCRRPSRGRPPNRPGAASSRCSPSS